MWDLIVSVPDHCLSFYFVYNMGSLKTHMPTLYIYTFDSLNIKFMYIFKDNLY